ncbi:hypothetical protein GLN3_08645 [Geobacillus lituanicus]|nr:hypothetical protein GLN3_08645 [Geobacillus lituanicus]
MKRGHVVLAAAFASALLFAPDEGKAAEWKEGMSSLKIKELQQLLKEKGFFTYPQATGYFGPITEEAVKAFQRAVNLPATGVVDDATYEKLRTFTPSVRTLAVGSRGDEVKVLQQQLKQLGYFQYPQITGYFGTVTEAAVKQFQQANGLPATGKADAVTIERLRQAASQRTTATSSSSATLSIGSRGSKVSELQNNLKRLGYFTYPKITGYYGTVTADAVRRFQKDAKLQATGIVDDATYERLIGQAPAPKGQAPASKLDVIELIADAAELLGTPYVWGGETPEAGFDCSGFIYYLFAQQGILLPRTVADIWSVGKPVSSPAVGDIVFFETYKKGPSHAGIYIGNGQFVHSGASTGVTTSRLEQSYWKQRYLGAKRY